ncbi:2TM domain-containing protein [Flavobacterium hauense]
MTNEFNMRMYYRDAGKRVKRIKDFYLRLAVYCTVNTLLFAVWMHDSYIAENFWKPTLSFTVGVAGLCLLANAVILYGEKYMLPKSWEERKLKEFMSKQNQTTIKYE